MMVSAHLPQAALCPQGRKRCVFTPIMHTQHIRSCCSSKDSSAAAPPPPAVVVLSTGVDILAAFDAGGSDAPRQTSCPAELLPWICVPAPPWLLPAAPPSAVPSGANSSSHSCCSPAWSEESSQRSIHSTTTFRLGATNSTSSSPSHWAWPKRPPPPPAAAAAAAADAAAVPALLIMPRAVRNVSFA